MRVYGRTGYRDIKSGVEHCAICLEIAPCERACHYVRVGSCSVYENGFALLDANDFIVVQREPNQRERER